MKVLVVSQYFWPENFRINDLVAELKLRGHEITVLTGKPNYPEGYLYSEFVSDPDKFDRYHGADIVRVPIFPRGRGPFRLMLNYVSFAISGSLMGLWRLRGRSFDVIFTCQLSPVTVGIPALVIRAIKKIPMALWVLDLWPETLRAVGTLKSKVLLNCVGNLVEYIYRRSDVILVQSKSFMPSIDHRLGGDGTLRYMPSWAEILPKAVDPASEMPSTIGSFNILFTGNIGDAQNFPAILKAAHNLRGHSSIKWWFVGSGRMSQWVSDEIKRYGLEDRVSMLGRFPLERMPAFFTRADALLISLKPDPVFDMTIPGKLQTYLSVGKPILAMLNGEGAALIRRAGCGMVCPAGDHKALSVAILEMYGMTAPEREKMGTRAIEFSNKEFNRERIVDQLENILKTLKFKQQSVPYQERG